MSKEAIRAMKTAEKKAAMKKAAEKKAAMKRAAEKRAAEKRAAEKKAEMAMSFKEKIKQHENEIGRLEEEKEHLEKEIGRLERALKEITEEEEEIWEEESPSMDDNYEEPYVVDDFEEPPLKKTPPFYAIDDFEESPLKASPFKATAFTLDGPAQAYHYWDWESQSYCLSLDIWEANQLSNGNYTPVWVWVTQGCIDHMLSSEEMRLYLPHK